MMDAYLVWGCEDTMQVRYAMMRPVRVFENMDMAIGYADAMSELRKFSHIQVMKIGLTDEGPVYVWPKGSNPLDAED